ncbi:MULTISPECIES: Rne/Rng family ribonuclease [unclassified Sphingomonas]|uniref:Rne/Rng family ribonuclease n=1 Tax=unclassified Sphingomonas TaxID=196159 RepID=UPI000AF1157D|nr:MULTISPECIES: ribonuclease E/G [unclassified Sphingomonas]
MTTRMLIDARHREETRVAVVKGNRIEEFDFESAERKQLKGNIYLAKVTRVEPSLQAAFVDYGGNRHGFLAFSEIHPDYYQIPKEDRDALLAEEAAHAAEEAALRAGDHDDDVDYDDHDHDDDAEGGVEVVERDEDEDDRHDDEEGEDAPAPRPRKGGGDDAAVEALRQRRLNLRRRYKIQDVIRRRQVLLVQVVKEERGNKGAALTTYLSLAGRYCVLMPNTAHGGGISRKISSAADRKRLKSIMAELTLPASMGCIVRTAGLQRSRQEIKRDFDYLARLWDGIRDQTLTSSAPALVYGDSDLIKRAIRDIYNKDVDEVIVEGEDGFRHAKEYMRLLMPAHARRVKQYADAVPLFQRAHVEDQLAAMYNPVVQLKSGGYLVINPTEALVSIDINSGRSTREHNIEQTATATNLEAAQEIARQLRLRDMAGLVVIDFIDMDHGSNVRKVEKAMKEALKNDRARIQVGRISAFGLMEMSRQRLRTGVLEASTRQCPHCEGTGLVRTASSAGLSALRLIEDEAARGRGSLIVLRASQEAAFYVLNKKRADIAEVEDRYGVTVEIVPDAEIEGARMAVEASGPPPAHPPKIEPLVIVDDEDDAYEDIEDEIDEEIEEDAVEETARPPRSDDEGEGRGKRRRRRRGRRGRNREEGDVEGEAGDDADIESDGDDAVDADDETVDAVVVDAETDESDVADDAAPETETADDGSRRKRRRRGRRGGRRGDGAFDAADGAGAVADLPVEDDVAEPAVVAEPAAAEPVVEPDLVEAEPTPAPKRTRRRPSARAKVETNAEPTPAEPVTIEAGDAAPFVVPAPVEPPVAEVEPAAEAPKPKRTRRRKADAEPAVVEEAPAPVEAEAEATPAPKKRRAPRRKPAETADVTEAAATAEPETVAAEPEPEETPANEEAAADGENPSPRRGWWQRTFGN